MRRGLAIALMAFTSCTHMPNLPAEMFDLGRGGYDCESAVQGIVDLHKQADERCVEYWYRQVDEWRGEYSDRHLDGPSRGRVDFDPNSYFDVLRHVHAPEGTVLDYVYHWFPGGGAPIMYLRYETSVPFAAYKDYASVHGGPSAYRRWCQELLKDLVLDGTPESFFELVVLDLIAGQFCLDWHANYFDTKIITARHSLDALLRDLEDEATMGQPITADQKERALAIDPRPLVGFREDNTAVVQVLAFSSFGGFDRITYEIAMSPPHKIKRKTTRVLVEYNCGIYY
jgi:hypothetical protein